MSLDPLNSILRLVVYRQCANREAGLVLISLWAVSWAPGHWYGGCIVQKGDGVVCRAPIRSGRIMTLMQRFAGLLLSILPNESSVNCPTKNLRLLRTEWLVTFSRQP